MQTEFAKKYKVQSQLDTLLCRYVCLVTVIYLK